METAIFKNDAEEERPLVAVTMMALEVLMREKPVVFYELVMKCRDDNHQFFGKSGEYLKELALVESDGSVHDSIRNIVLSIPLR